MKSPFVPLWWLKCCYMAREGGGKLGQGMQTAAEKGNFQQGEELERAKPLLCAAGGEKLGERRELREKLGELRQFKCIS